MEWMFYIFFPFHTGTENFIPPFQTTRDVRKNIKIGFLNFFNENPPIQTRNKFANDSVGRAHP